MKNQKLILPTQYKNIFPTINLQVEALPFYVKEVGYLKEHRFLRGDSNNYNEYMLLYSLDSMKFSKNRNVLPIHEHDVVFSACNCPLIFTSPRNHPGTFMYIIICGAQIQYFYNLIRKNNSLYHTNPLGNIQNYFFSLLHLNYDKDPLMTQMEAGSVLYPLLLELYKLSREILEIKKISPVQDSAVTTALKYIHENYQADLDIDTICEKVSFSKYYFCKLFKEHTHMTIHRYVTEYRINKSKELLSYSKLSIANVASSVGFKNTLTFSRCFEKQMHMTPSEYRQAY